MSGQKRFAEIFASKAYEIRKQADEISTTAAKLKRDALVLEGLGQL